MAARIDYYASVRVNLRVIDVFFVNMDISEFAVSVCVVVLFLFDDYLHCDENYFNIGINNSYLKTCGHLFPNHCKIRVTDIQ